MSRSMFVLFAAAALAACDTSRIPTAPELTAVSSSAAVNSQQMAVGAGDFARPFSRGHFTVSAHSDIGGANPRGNASITADQDAPFLDFDVQGPVTCLAIAGNKAAVGIKVAKGSFGGVDMTGRGIVLLVEDNGPPGHGVPDGATNGGFHPDGDNIPCAAELNGQPAPNTSGNVVIK